MRVRERRSDRNKQNPIRRGAGGFISKVINRAIDKLPLEFHLKGYQFCGPGTKLQERLARGDQGINPLDEACKIHDIAYAKYSDSDNRRVADKELAERAWARVKSTDAKFGEKAAAWLVTNTMKVKSKIGSGRVKRRKQCPKRRGKGILKGSSTQLRRRRRRQRQRRGGVLPLLPIFAGLSALGSLAGGASAVAKAIRDGKNSSTKLAGKGLYIRPYKSGGGAKKRQKKKRSGKKKKRQSP